MNLSEDSVIALLTATISAMALMGVAVLPMLVSTHRRVKRSAKDSKATREQVVNSHTTNLRVESDERHLEVMKKLDETKAAVNTNTDRIAEAFIRLKDIEDTIPPIIKRRRTP